MPEPNNNPTHPFWSSDALRSIAGIVCSDAGDYSNPTGYHNLAVCKTDYIHRFMRSCLPANWFGTIISGDSDTPFSEEHVAYLDDTRVAHWFATNLKAVHTKLHAIPLGIPDSRRPFQPPDCAARGLRDYAQTAGERTTRFASHFNPATGGDRSECIGVTGIQPTLMSSYADYVRSLSSSLFVLSPCGAGFDCWRTWEALYCGAVPVITSHAAEGVRVFECLEGLPAVILHTWADFKPADFTTAKHAELWSGRSPKELEFEPLFSNYMAKYSVTLIPQPGHYTRTCDGSV